MRSPFQANPPDTPCPAPPPSASNPDYVSLTSPSLSPAQFLLTQNSTGTPPLRLPQHRPLCLGHATSGPSPSHGPSHRPLASTSRSPWSRPCAPQTLQLDRVPDSVSRVRPGLLTSAPRSLRRCVPHCCTGPGGAHVRPEGPSHSLGGGKQAATSPAIRGFLHQSILRSPHSWRKACTPRDPLKGPTVNIHCAVHLPGPFPRPLGPEGGASRASRRRPGEEEEKPGAGSPRRGGASLQTLGLPPVCAWRSVTVSVLRSVSRQLDLGAQCPRAPRVPLLLPPPYIIE